LKDRHRTDNNDFPRIEKSPKIMNHSFEKPSNKIDREFSNQPFDKMTQYFLDNGTDNDKYKNSWTGSYS
jgi:hypothetical protein